MTNINIRKTTHWNQPYYLVRATTKRFGEQEIMCESFRLEDCVEYIKHCGYSIKPERMRMKGFSIVRHIDGTYTIKYKSSNGDTYTAECNDFLHAGSYVYEIADNNDIGSAVNQRMCEVFRGNFIEGDHLEPAQLDPTRLWY